MKKEIKNKRLLPDPKYSKSDPMSGVVVKVTIDNETYEAVIKKDHIVVTSTN